MPVTEPDGRVDRLPIIMDWIDRTLESHVQRRRPVQSLKFQRLPNYFTASLLATTSVVIVDRVPVPPLTALGLTGFESFERQAAIGITYRNAYFLQREFASCESLHCHELVHIVQWHALGPEKFLLMYAEGLARHGYAESPLEAMAIRHQQRFEYEKPYSIEKAVRIDTLVLGREMTQYKHVQRLKDECRYERNNLED